MKLYIISGLGADFTVLEKIKFPPHIHPIFIPWLVPHKDETTDHYVQRMAQIIDTTEPFALLGYSFGGFVVQKIHQKTPAQQVIILASIKSNKELPTTAKIGKYTRIPHILPTTFFKEKTIKTYSFLRKLIDTKNPNILRYFQMKDPYYLKWSMEHISDWHFEDNPDTIQIMGDKDIVFPIKNSHPNYIIQGGTHLFPITKHRQVSSILAQIFKQ